MQVGHRSSHVAPRGWLVAEDRPVRRDRVTTPPRISTPPRCRGGGQPHRLNGSPTHAWSCAGLSVHHRTRGGRPTANHIPGRSRMSTVRTSSGTGDDERTLFEVEDQAARLRRRPRPGHRGRPGRPRAVRVSAVGFAEIQLPSQRGSERSARRRPLKLPLTRCYARRTPRRRGRYLESGPVESLRVTAEGRRDAERTRRCVHPRPGCGG